MSSQIILLPGMSPDLRLFDRLLPLLPGAVVVPWIEPRDGESIRQYAQRLAGTLPTNENCVVCGVSFGGIVAQELAQVISARGCILVSSIRSPAELPRWFRWLAYSRLTGERSLAVVGRMAKSMPRRVRSRSTARLTKLAGDRGRWHRWATSAVLRWCPKPELDRIATLQIHGDGDRTFPIRYLRPDIVIRGGGHVLPLTHPQELAAIISRSAERFSHRSQAELGTEKLGT